MQKQNISKNNANQIDKKSEQSRQVVLDYINGKNSVQKNSPTFEKEKQIPTASVEKLKRSQKHSSKKNTACSKPHQLSKQAKCWKTINLFLGIILAVAIFAAILIFLSN